MESYLDMHWKIHTALKFDRWKDAAQYLKIIVLKKTWIRVGYAIQEAFFWPNTIYIFSTDSVIKNWKIIV